MLGDAQDVTVKLLKGGHPEGELPAGKSRASVREPEGERVRNVPPNVLLIANLILSYRIRL